MRALLALLAVACHHDPAPVSPPPRPLDPVTTEEPAILCASYAYFILYPSVTIGGAGVFDRATEVALHEDTIAKQVDERGDHHEAALRFLACAKAYRVVPETDASWSTAKKNADLCYANAMWAFANARAWAKEGQAALARAIVDDPRLADAIRARMAEAPTECDP